MPIGSWEVEVMLGVEVVVVVEDVVDVMVGALAEVPDGTMGTVP